MALLMSPVPEDARLVEQTFAFLKTPKYSRSICLLLLAAILSGQDFPAWFHNLPKQESAEAAQTLADEEVKRAIPSLTGVAAEAVAAVRRETQNGPEAWLPLLRLILAL